MADTDNPLTRLIAGNYHWSGNVDARTFEQSTERGKPPRVLWIGCADSRVPESVITIANPGDIFVHRNVANQVQMQDVNLLSLVHFAVNALNVEHVIVVGHEACGGVDACIPNPYPDQAQHKGFLGEWLTPLTTHALEGEWTPPLSNPPPEKSLRETLLTLVQEDQRDEALKILVEENVKLQVQNLSQHKDLVQPSGAEVLIHGWVYDVNSGRLRVLEDVTRPAGWSSD